MKRSTRLSEQRKRAKSSFPLFQEAKENGEMEKLVTFALEDADYFPIVCQLVNQICRQEKLPPSYKYWSEATLWSRKVFERLLKHDCWETLDKTQMECYFWCIHGNAGFGELSSKAEVRK